MKHILMIATIALTACSAQETRPIKGSQTETAKDSVIAPTFKPGQHWTFRRIDLWRNEETERFRQEFVFEEAGRWMVRWTILNSDDPVRRGSITGELFDPVSHIYADKKISGRYEYLRFPLATGKTWSFNYEVDGGLRKTTIQQQATVTGWETVTVPAGKYRALRVEHHGRYTASESSYSWSGTIRETYWYVPEVSRVVMREYRDTKGDGGIWDQWRDELVDYSAQIP